MTAEVIDLREKYRPKKFADVVGNKRIIKYLKNSALTSHTSNGVIFHGISGTGKTACAEVYSKALNCLNFNGDVCGKCKPCQSIQQSFPGSSITYGVHIHDCTLIDEKKLDALIYDQLRHVTFSMHFSKTNKDIHIFDEFHRIRDRSQDKFLRLLETKPYLLFIFCLIDISLIEEALRQRLTVLKTSLPEMEEILAWLEHICSIEGIVVKDKEALEHLAKEADLIPRECIGTLQTILDLREPITVELIRELSRDKVSVKGEEPGYRIIE